MKILISNKARRDLLQIYSHIAAHNPDAAESVLQDIQRKIENLSRFPFIGPERPNLFVGLRSLVAGTHLIFYAIDDAHVTIHRVIDGRMDVDKELLR
jgi:toxin ParE1/3/4